MTLQSTLDITVSIQAQGATGDRTYFISQNGGAFNQVTMASDSAGGIAGYDAMTSDTGATGTGTIPGTAARLRISRANFGGNRTMTLRVDGATAGRDAITFFRVDQGADGQDAIIVVVTASNGFVYRNAGGTDKTLTCTVYDAGTGNEITTNLSYAWSRSGSGSVSAGAVRVTSATDRSVIDSGGVEASGSDFQTISVGSEDVTAEEAFTCTVTCTP